VQKISSDEAIIQLHFYERDHLRYVHDIEIKVQNDYRKQLSKIERKNWRCIF